MNGLDQEQHLRMDYTTILLDKVGLIERKVLDRACRTVAVDGHP